MQFQQAFLAIRPEPSKPAPDNSLLYLADEGRVVIPRFQRDFEWKPDFVVALIASVARNWPSGQLLLMKGTRNFPSRALRGVDEDVGDVQYSVLDGQQRLTALYRAFFDKDPKRVFYFRVGAYMREGRIVDESFAYVARGTWDKICPDYGRQADPATRALPAGKPSRPATQLVDEDRVLTLRTYLDENEWAAWLNHIPQKEHEEYRLHRGALKDRLTTYQFPVTLIEEGDTEETLTSLFVTVNLRQRQLGTFDLVVAKSWRKDSFDLRQKWFESIGRDQEGQPGAEAKHASLRDFRLDPEVLLRLIALLAGFESTSKANLVALEPDFVRANTDKVLKALDGTLVFLQAHAGVIPESLPSEAGILPIARALVEKPALTRSEASANRLLQWFWLTSFGQRYGRGGTNTLVVQDARDLQEWLEGGQTPKAIVEFSFKRSDLFDEVTGNEMLLNGVFCLENFAGARDWITGELISENGRKPRQGGGDPSSVLGRHHIFPQDMNHDHLRESITNDSPLPWDDAGFEPVDMVSNRALLFSGTNSEVGSHSPESVESIKGVRAEWLTTYLMDWDGDRGFEPFIVARAQRICERLEDMLRPIGFELNVPDKAS